MLAPPTQHHSFFRNLPLNGLTNSYASSFRKAFVLVIYAFKKAREQMVMSGSYQAVSIIVYGFEGILDFRAFGVVQPPFPR